MSVPLISAIRQQHQLKESLLHTAQELAHRASIYGVVRVSYSYLARKCHCARRTIIRHIQRLIEANILRKSVLWIRGNYCEVNTYTFCIAWKKPSSVQGGDKKTCKFSPQEERGKKDSIRDEMRHLEQGLRFCTPGSLTYTATITKLEELRALAEVGHERR